MSPLHDIHKDEVHLVYTVLLLFFSKAARVKVEPHTRPLVLSPEAVLPHVLSNKTSHSFT